MYELEDYLRKEGIFEKFLKNISNFRIGVPKRIRVENAFIWDVTPEGEAYWRKIASEAKELKSMNTAVYFCFVIPRFKEEV